MCVSVHHRKPRSRGGKDYVPNCVNVSLKSHKAWHRLFQNYEPETIAEIINGLWLDPEFEFVCKRRQQGKDGEPINLVALRNRAII